jgi:hypothetical protein
VGKRLLPLILIGEERRGKCFVVGVSPLQSTIGDAAQVARIDGDEKQLDRISTLTNFKLYFKMAAKEAGLGPVMTSTKSVLFDANIIEVPHEDAREFVYQMSQVMKHFVE